MKSTYLILALLIASSALLACSSGGDRPSTTTAASNGETLSNSDSARVQRAATIANALESNPDNADRILRDHGMSEQQFEDLMYEIAADPELSAAYNARVR